MVRKKTNKNGFARKRYEEKQKAEKYLTVFTLKFLFAAIFTIIPLSLLPEDWYAPLNRLTAFLSCEILKTFTPDTVLHGTHISVGEFRVNVISECSAVHLIALLISFVFAFPSKLTEKLYAICIGTLFLYTINIMRISLITVIGCRIPDLFDIAHIYLGQLVMIILMICFSLYWCQRVSDAANLESPVYFIFRFLFFSSILLIIWLPLNRSFMAIVDYFVQWFFTLINRPIVISHMHSIYFQTFSVISLAGLLMAFRKVELSIRIRWIACGILLLIVFQFLHRVSNALITAYHVERMVVFSRIIYNLCVYSIPVFFALKLFMHSRLAGIKPVSR